MATRPHRELKIGDIIDRTADMLGANAVPVLVFVVVLSALGSVVDYFSRQVQQQAAAQQAVSLQSQLQLMIFALVLVVVSIVAAYLLVETMLRRSGLMGEAGERRFFAFLGMSLLTALGFVVGLILLVIPGLVFAARWSLAPSLLIGRRQGAIEAMSTSWAMTRGNEVSIIVAGLAMQVLFYAVAFLPPYLFAEQTIFTGLLSRLGSSAASVIATAMGVALFGMFASRDVTETFA